MPDEDDFAARIEQALDGADVSLVDAMHAAEAAVPSATLIGAELRVRSQPPDFAADLWSDRSLVRVEVGLDGRVGDPSSEGVGERAKAAAEVCASAPTSLYDAVATAEDVVAESRAFQVGVDGVSYTVEVVSAAVVYELEVAPEDGSVLRVDAETGDGWHHHDCPHYGC